MPNCFLTPSMKVASSVAALWGADLRTAAERIAKFKPLIGPVVLDVTSGPRGLQLAFRWPEGPPPARS